MSSSSRERSMAGRDLSLRCSRASAGSNRGPRSPDAVQPHQPAPEPAAGTTLWTRPRVGYVPRLASTCSRALGPNPAWSLEVSRTLAASSWFTARDRPPRYPERLVP